MALFLVRDLIATFIVLSYEPGIPEVAVRRYAFTLLPGTFFVVTGYAPAINLVFGLGIGVILYVWFTRRMRASQRVVDEQV